MDLIEATMSPLGSGAGTALNPVLLACAGVATLVATLISFGSIYLHLKNYRKNTLQRMVIRIMIMIPIYGISSFVSLISLQAAFFIDAVRDVYEAFVIYVFFQLLIAYLGGERSLLILLHGRPPVHPLFPVNLFKRELDASDPYTYLWLKRGILQYVQVKPALAAATIILKALGKFDEGDLKAGSGYLYISIIYNISIGVALYCLAMFWIVVNSDLRPFRPVPKFLCVKGILFFSFWQSFFISILVAAGVVRSLGPYKKASFISLALTDLLICLEMPLFAIAHMYAFSHTDYIDKDLQYCARMPLRYAFRDAFGFKDVIEDSKATLRGEGMDYRTFEPAEGKMHQGSGRDRRIRAGLRYVQGGKQKYWLPKPYQDISVEASAKKSGGGGLVDKSRLRTNGVEEEVHAPLLESQARGAVRIAPDLRGDSGSDDGEIDSDGFSLTYSDPHASDDELYEHSRDYLFGDYNYPCIDVSGEMARRSMWEEEERILRNQRAAFFSPALRAQSGLLAGERRNYGTAGATRGSRYGGGSSSSVIKGKDVERRHDSILDADSFGEEQIKGAAVIDMDNDRIPDLEAGVKMRWSKSGKFVPSLQRRGSPSTWHPPSHGGGQDSLSADPEPPRSGPSSPSRLRRRSPPPHAASALPRDAVDLVVEDTEAKERAIRERRKGEPTTHGQIGDSKALRRVYKHRYKSQEEEGGEADVEVSKERDFGNATAEEDQETLRPSRTNVKVTRGSDTREEGKLLRNTETVGVMDTIFTRNSPPLSAQQSLDEDNPWL